MNPDADRLLDDAERLLEKAAHRLRPKTACPICGSRDSRVTDGRDVERYGPGYWRRRVCLKCGAHYRTEEVTREVIHKKSASA